MDERNSLPESGERLDYVPWSSFEAPRHPSWAPWLAAVAVVLIGGAAVFILSNRPPSALDTPSVAPAPEPSLPLTTPTSTRPLSEADLRAAHSPADGAIGALAESFVFGYFTIDAERSAGAPAELAATLGSLPETASYVEWVAAEDVVEVEPDRYHVDVRFRLLVMTQEARRLDGALVRVTVVDDGQGLAIVGLPVFLKQESIRLVEDANGEDAGLTTGPGGIPVLGQP